GVLAELEHKLQRVDALLAVDRRLSIRIKHFRAKCPEDRHEISHRGIPTRRSHNIAVDTSSTRGPRPLALIDGSNCGQHIVPRCRFFETVFLEQIFAVEKQLRVADIRQSVQLAALVRMLAYCDRRANEIFFWPWLPASLIHRTQRRKKLFAGESWEPRIVEHDQIVCSGPGHQVDMFLLKKIVIRKFGDADPYAGKGFIIASGLLECIPLDTRVDRQGELLCSAPAAFATNQRERDKREKQ